MKTPNTLFVGIVALLMLAGLVLLPRLPENTQPSSFDTSANIRFTASGDFGSTRHTKKVLQQIGSLQPDFHIALGDLSYDELNPEERWCNYVKENIGGVPFQLLPGNHEEDGSAVAISKFAKCLPNRVAGMKGDYPQQYYFDYDQLARFIFVSPDINVSGKSYQYRNGDSDYVWLKEAIATAEDRWLIVSMHKNCISIGEKTCEIGPELFNFLIAQKVDLILQAHDHSYQRSYPLALGSGCPQIIPGQFNRNCVRAEGTTLIITGASGRSYYELKKSDPEYGYFANASFKPSYGLTSFSVFNDRIVGKFGRASGADFVDEFNIAR